MNKVLIDTNVFIYALDNDSVFYTRASQILSDENLVLYTTSKNISEYFAVCTKLQLNPKAMFGFFDDIRSNIQIIFPSEGSLTHFEKLVKKYSPKGNRIFDIEIVSVMIHFDIQYLATFNEKDFIEISEIKIWG